LLRKKSVETSDILPKIPQHSVHSNSANCNSANANSVVSLFLTKVAQEFGVEGLKDHLIQMLKMIL